jgi:hypothetical protein
MMAYMIMTNKTSRAMCRRGIMAIRILFSTTWRPGKGLKGFNTRRTCGVDKASLVQEPREQLEPDDGENDYDEHDEEGNVKEGDHGHQDGV